MMKNSMILKILIIGKQKQTRTEITERLSGVSARKFLYGGNYETVKKNIRRIDACRRGAHDILSRLYGRTG